MLRLLEREPDMSQRPLARALSLSVGKTHYALRAVLDRGWVKAQNFRRSDNRIEVLDEQIAVLEEDLDTLYERLGQEGDITGLIVAQQIGDLRRELAELRTQRVDARSDRETVEAMSRDTEQTFLAGESEDPVGAGRSLIVALSVVLGGMLGLFAAFFSEFVSNARSRRPEPS